jgi:FSR family fosmidomycin resistance protein-like MFS transporter
MRAMPAIGDRSPHLEATPHSTATRASGGVAAVALFAATGHLGLELVSNFLPIVYPTMVAEAGFSFAQVGTVTLVATLGMTLPQPLFGMLVRRFDAGRLVIAAVLWCGLCYGLVGLAGGFWPLLAVVALGGLGSALFHPAGSVVASAARSRRRGAAMSIFSVGGNAGAALSPLLMAAVLGWFGLAGTLVTIPLAAASGLILMLLARHGAVSAATDGLATAGRRGRCANDQAASEPAAGAEPADSRHHRAPAPSADGANGTAVLALALIVLFAMSRAWYQVSLTTYLPLWVAEHGSARVGIAQVLFVLAGSLPAGAVLGGALSDRVGRWQVVLAAAVLLVPANAALLTVGPGGAPATLLLLTAAIGCLIGATYPVAIIIAQEAWPRNIGLAGGMIMGLGWLPGGVGASAVGMMADNIGLARALATQAIPLAIGVLAVAAYALLTIRGRRGKG